MPPSLVSCMLYQQEWSPSPINTDLDYNPPCTRIYGAQPNTSSMTRRSIFWLKERKVNIISKQIKVPGRANYKIDELINHIIELNLVSNWAYPKVHPPLQKCSKLEPKSVSEQVNDDENLNSTTHLILYFTPYHFLVCFCFIFIFLGVRNCES